MSSVLIAYSTVDGHTLSICRRIQALLESEGHAVTLVPIDEALAADGSGFDAVLIGASIRYGKHRPSVYEFVARHRQLLGQVPSAFFSVCAVARKPGKDTPTGNPYFRKFVRKSGWQPALGAVFGGRIDYAKYKLSDRLLIRFIMWVTQGPTDLNVAVEFTDWGKVDAFAGQVAALSRTQAPARRSL